MSVTCCCFYLEVLPPTVLLSCHLPSRKCAIEVVKNKGFSVKISVVSAKACPKEDGGLVPSSVDTFGSSIKILVLLNASSSDDADDSSTSSRLRFPSNLSLPMVAFLASKKERMMQGRRNESIIRNGISVTGVDWMHGYTRLFRQFQGQVW